MSYHLVYADPEGKPTDGDQLATGAGWLAWGDHVLTNQDQFPECAHLAQEGWADRLADMEHEAELLTHEKDGNVAAVSANLLAAVRGRPADTEAVLVTDGTEPGDDEEDADDSDTE